jgi:hypothetical protein
VADDLTELTGVAPTLDGVDVSAGPPLQPRGSSKHRGRFLLAYGALALALAGAIAGLVVLIAKPGAEPDVAWSTWQPAGEEEVPKQIADYVGAQYHLASGAQLVGVQAAPPRVQDLPIGAIATRKPPGAGVAGEPEIDVIDVDGSVVYILCGLGANCAIEEGEPSAERLRLLRRQGLELALYTFRYMDDTKNVVAFLPPPPGEQPSYALFFRRGDLEAELDQPLRETLPDAVPPLAENISPLEVAAIDRLTTSSLYRFQFQQLQDGTAVLVLNDPSLAPLGGEEDQQAEQGSATTASE